VLSMQQHFTRALLELLQQHRRQQRRRSWLHDCAQGAGKGSNSPCSSSPALANPDPAASGHPSRHSTKNCQSLVEPKSRDFCQINQSRVAICWLFSLWCDKTNPVTRATTLERNYSSQTDRKQQKSTTGLKGCIALSCRAGL
jgi:hypothetical protein